MPSKAKLHPLIAAYGDANKKAMRAIYRAIERYDRIVVFRHIKPDFDAMGTQMGFYTFLKDNFPNKEIHFVGDNHISFTGRLFPETERLNDAFFSDRNFLAIVLDVGDHERIADPRYKKAKYIVKIDHHPCKTQIAKATLCDLEMAAASELAVDLLLNWKGKFISAEAAKYFYIALVGDSGRFMYSSTSPHTFAIAQALVETGFNLREVYLAMYEKTIDSLNSLSYVLANYKISAHGVAYYCLPKDIQEQLHITPELGKEHVNTFSNVAGINAWCSITEDPNPKDYCWRISIRSKAKDISGIANKWGGGGHAQASGAKIKNLDELDAFIDDLDALFR
ncbi:MAG: bifunctional oligoribonuclease/PAP phosphatase NrnA [Bacilli bacterium]|nr:bifunctional oligoribonuclease/PAP phosphatase NrnA [Bacilli bacterium]